MWIVEMLLLSLVGGTILGVSWRLYDDWKERSKQDAVQKSVIEVDTTNRQ